MADCSTIQTRLNAARSAYDDLVAGRAVRKFVDQNGETVEYTSANRRDLLMHIRGLEAELDACQGATARYRGPLRFTFGRRPY